MALQIPLQISFKDIRHSDAVEAAIRERAAKLEVHAGGRLTSCRVTVKEPNQRRRQGDLFVVTIDVTMPGIELAVGHSGNHGDERSHENIYSAVRDSFQAMERQIHEYIEKRRHDIKLHTQKPRARVSRLFPQDGYGFITTPDGREVYFHLNSIVEQEKLDVLEVGVEVRFTEELGDKGPQASSVIMVL